MKERKAKGEYVVDFPAEEESYAQTVDDHLQYVAEVLSRYRVPRHVVESLIADNRAILQAQVLALQKEKKLLTAQVCYWANPERLLTESELWQALEQLLTKERGPEFAAAAFAALRHRYPHPYLRLVK